MPGRLGVGETEIIVLLPVSPLLFGRKRVGNSRGARMLGSSQHAAARQRGSCRRRRAPPARHPLTRPACAPALTPGWGSSARLVRRSSTEYLGSLAQIAPTTSTSTTRILTVGSRASSRPAPLQPNRGGRSLHAPARAPLSATEATPPLNLRSRLAQLHKLNLTSCCFRPLINTCSHEHAEDLECY